MSPADHFLTFCARHFAPCRRDTLTDAELLSIVENHPALHDLTHPRADADTTERPACEPCDRAQILIARMQNGLGWRAGLPITQAMWDQLAPHIRIGLDTEVEAGGAYLNNGWNRRGPATHGTTERPDLTREDLQSELDTRTRERDEARIALANTDEYGAKILAEKQFAEAEREDASGEAALLREEAEGEREGRLSAEALLKEAGQVLEPFARFGSGMPDAIPGQLAMTNGSPLARRQVMAGEFRAAANLHARIVEQGSSAQSQPCGAREPISRAAGEAEPTAAVELLERLQAIIDWADLALSNPGEFDSHGVRNLDGPVFDEARAAIAKAGDRT